jgi:uncharacterized protein YbjT (DUF2867 family)
MHILWCGDQGFIGQHLAARLRASGHEVRGLAGLDFCQALSPSRWRPALQGVQAVVNAVGVLRDTRRRPMTLVHARAPLALFQACAELGVRRVLHVSALGLTDQATAYAHTKLQAEQALRALTERGALDGVVLQPSVVMGQGGASTQLFLRLARLPWLPLPAAATRCPVQPVAVADLAAVVEHLLQSTGPWPTTLACTGPQTLAELIALLRHHNGLAPATCWPLPEAITRLSAHLGDTLPFTPWCSESLALMSQANGADHTPFAQWLGREPMGVLAALA